MFEADVQTAVDLGVTHVSVYPLTIEDHTPFRRMVDSGEIDDVDQDKEALMMSMAPNVLTPAGFHRMRWRAMRARVSNASTTLSIGRAFRTLAWAFLPSP